MINWLASYPRSGNTLLRTILKTCFGLMSYDSMRANLFSFGLMRTGAQRMKPQAAFPSARCLKS